MALSDQTCAEIDSCSYLLLREIAELDHNGVRLIIEEGQVSPEAMSIKVGSTEIKDGHSVESTDDSRLFELVWDYYVAYSVRNESFVTCDEHEKWTGRRLCFYSESHFLDSELR